MIITITDQLTCFDFSWNLRSWSLSLMPFENRVCYVPLVNRAMLPSSAVRNVSRPLKPQRSCEVIRDVRMICDAFKMWCLGLTVSKLWTWWMNSNCTVLLFCSKWATHSTMGTLWNVLSLEMCVLMWNISTPATCSALLTFTPLFPPHILKKGRHISKNQMVGKG